MVVQQKDYATFIGTRFHTAYVTSTATTELKMFGTGGRIVTGLPMFKPMSFCHNVQFAHIPLVKFDHL